MMKSFAYLALVALFCSAAFASPISDEDDDLPLACPFSAKDLCYSSNNPLFTGSVECDKPVLCGDVKLYGKDVAPLGTVCEYDSEDPQKPSKVCNGEGKCTKFYLDRGDC